MPRPVAAGGPDKKFRFAGQDLLEKIGYQRAAALGLGGLAAGTVAAGQLTQVNPATGEADSNLQNMAGGAGSVLGGIGGGLLLAPLGPWASAAGAWAGSELGGRASRASAGLFEDLTTPSELEKQISDGRKMNEALRQERMLAIPVGEAEAMAANRSQADLMNSQIAAQSRLEQQRALLAAALAGSARPVQMESLGNSLAGAAQMMGAFG